MKKDWIICAILWVFSSIVLEMLAITFLKELPTSAAEQAKIIDDAFFLLLYLCIPIFTLVVVFLFYSVLRFRVSGRPVTDGPGLTGNSTLTITWVLASLILTAFVFVHPGVTGLQKLRAAENEVPDMVVYAEAQRFSWKITYAAEGVFTRKEIVLPKDKNIKFKIESKDVLHAFWIPAFRVKIDAVPGLITEVNATPTEFGSYDNDPNFRLQCAELCGLGHSVMSLPVRVVTEKEYAEWIKNQTPTK